MRKEDPLIQEFCEFHKTNNALAALQKIHEIVESGDKEQLDLLRLLTWPSPQQSDLTALGDFLGNHKVRHVYSVGCGTGLLEWLLANCLEEQNVGVTGIEIDFGWWSSAYSPPTFLQPLLFCDKDFNSSEPFGEMTDLALFCYFNNLKVFLDYLKVFRGKFVAILGPMSNTQFCEPAPLDLQDNHKLTCEKWQLLYFTPFGLGNVDHLAIYTKIYS